MKFLIQFSALLVIAFFFENCEGTKHLDTGHKISGQSLTSEKLKYLEAYNKVLTLIKTPFDEIYISTTFGNAHVIVSGPVDAPPVVLMHGLNASSTMWYPNIKPIAEYYRVYAIDDLTEPGKSQMHIMVKNMDDLMNWYGQIFDHFGLKEFNLIGASKGGWLATFIALKDRYQISSIILLSPAQTFSWISRGPEIITNLNYILDPRRKNLRNVMETMSTYVDQIDTAYLAQYYYGLQNAGINHFIRKMKPYSRKQLEKLTLPIMLLIGDQDIINKKKVVKKARKLIPQAESEIIENAGHFLSMDQSEVINSKIIDFLKSNTSNYVKAD